jgi:hypothetical protein
MFGNLPRCRFGAISKASDDSTNELVEVARRRGFRDI